MIFLVNIKHFIIANDFKFFKFGNKQPLFCIPNNYNNHFKVANYSVDLKNYNIFLFLPFLNISYLSLISLSQIDLYL